jgi:pre-mRNA-processing factor SLU7
MLKETSKVSILAKYGGEKYLERAPKELLQGQTEDYVEYSRTGQVVKGRERAKAKSKYPEDGMCCYIRSRFFSPLLIPIRL